MERFVRASACVVMAIGVAGGSARAAFAAPGLDLPPVSVPEVGVPRGLPVPVPLPRTPPITTPSVHVPAVPSVDQVTRAVTAPVRPRAGTPVAAPATPATRPAAPAAATPAGTRTAAPRGELRPARSASRQAVKRRGGAHSRAVAAGGARRPTAARVPGATIRPLAAVRRTTEPTAKPVPRRILDDVLRQPWTLIPALLALAAIALAMTSRSAGLVRLSRRMRRRGDELADDVGALQSALLPTVPERIGSVALSVAFAPDDGPAAGGDFHDVLRLPGGSVGVIVGDLSGHGRDALRLTGLVHFTLRAYVEAGMRPRDALHLADRALGGKLGSDYASALIAIYDPAESVLEYATAGHPVPLVVGQGDDHVVEAMTPPPIGIGRPTGTRHTRVSIAYGSRIVLFTDGVVDARTTDGGPIGRDGLAAEIDRAADAQDAMDRVHAATGGPRDDRTLLVLTPRDACRGGTVSEELEIPLADELPRAFAEFLAGCGLDEAASLEAIAAVTERAHAGLASVLRVRRGTSSTEWLIATPEPARPVPVDV